MSFSIKEMFCPLCNDQFMERKENGTIKFLPNHWQYQVKLNTDQKAWFGVCVKHKKEITKKLSDELLEAHKKFWDDEVEKNSKIKNKESTKSKYQDFSIKSIR